MNTSILVAGIVTRAPSGPIVSAQKKPAPTKSLMSRGMDRNMSRVNEKIKEMQQQLG